MTTDLMRRSSGGAPPYLATVHCYDDDAHDDAGDGRPENMARPVSHWPGVCSGADAVMAVHAVTTS